MFVHEDFIRYLLLAIVALLLAYIVHTLYVWMEFWFSQRAAMSPFPNPSGHWFWGNLVNVSTESWLAVRCSIAQLYRRVYVVWNGPFLPQLTLVHPETVKPVLLTSDGKGFEYDYFLKPWLGDGLLTLRGERWHNRRRLLTSVFHFESLKAYVPAYNDAIDTLIKKMDVLLVDSNKPDGNVVVECFGLLSPMTLDVILQCAFSFQSDCQTSGKSDPYIVAVSCISDLILKRGMRPWLYLSWLYYFTEEGRLFRKYCDMAHSTARNLINKRRSMKTTEVVSKRLCFIDILLAAKDSDGNSLEDQDILDEVNTFLFAGHDTTASSLSWTLYALAQNVHYQQLIQQEVDDLMSTKNLDHDGNVHLDLSDVASLRYLNLCIREANRMYSPVPNITRRLESPLTIDGYTLPAGSNVQVPIYVLHRQDNLFPDPKKFDPERFERCSSDSQVRDPFAYIPFSAGPRNCIGQTFALNEEKIILARLLHRYSFDIVPESVPIQKAQVVLRSSNGINLKIRRRI